MVMSLFHPAALLVNSRRALIQTGDGLEIPIALPLAESIIFWAERDLKVARGMVTRIIHEVRYRTRYDYPYLRR